MDDIEKIRASFFIEAAEILENLEALLLDLENAPEDPDLINAVFREMHTLKGSSGICELHELERIAHVLEDLLEYLRSENIAPTVEIMDTLFGGLDTVKAVFTMIRKGEEIDENILRGIEGKIKTFLPEVKVVEAEEEVAEDAGLYVDFIKELSDSVSEKVSQSADDSKRIYQIGLKMDSDCMSRGTDPFLLIKTLTYDGEVLQVLPAIENIPPLNELDPVHLYIDDIKIIFASALGLNEVNEIFEFARQSGVIEIHQFTPMELKEFFGVEYDDFWMEAAPEEEEELEVADLLDPSLFFSEARKRLADLEVQFNVLENEPGNKETADNAFRHFHTINGDSKLYEFSEISNIAHFSEIILDKIRSGDANATSATLKNLHEAANEIKSFIDMREEKEGFELEGEEGNGVTAKKLGEILVEMGELTENQLQAVLEEQQMPLGALLVEEGIVPKDKVDKALERQKTLGITPHAAIRVDTEKLDKLVNMVGELVITQTLLSHNDSIKQASKGDHNLLKTLSQLDKITREVQGNVMSIRMLPIKSTFQKLMRLARDVSKKEGKLAKINIEGEETELDKTVIDEIGDPLIHIMRNAIDHGIETPDERKEAGKKEAGSIELRAFHQGGNIVIEIKDDGRGLDREEILQKAKEKGLLHPDKELSDEEVYDLIFHPGFSTAKVVTDVSGRGVGMDVVKKNVEKLRGKVEIRSEKGAGSVFTIKLPLTLAVIDGMVVRVGKEKYIIPTISVVESLRPTKEQIITVKETGEMVNIRSNLFPLVRLHELFGVSPLNENPWEAMVIHVEGEGKKSCLLVDELIGQQQVVIKSLGESFKKISYVSGGAIMGDGRVGLILDPGGIIAAST